MKDRLPERTNVRTFRFVVHDPIYESSLSAEEEIPLPLLAALYVRATSLPLIIVHTWLAGGKVATVSRHMLQDVTSEVEEAARRQMQRRVAA